MTPSKVQSLEEVVRTNEDKMLKPSLSNNINFYIGRIKCVVKVFSFPYIPDWQNHMFNCTF